MREYRTGTIFPSSSINKQPEICPKSGRGQEDSQPRPTPFFLPSDSKIENTAAAAVLLCVCVYAQQPTCRRYSSNKESIGKPTIFICCRTYVMESVHQMTSSNAIPIYDRFTKNAQLIPFRQTCGSCGYWGESRQTTYKII